MKINPDLTGDIHGYHGPFVKGFFKYFMYKYLNFLLLYKFKKNFK